MKKGKRKDGKRGMSRRSFAALSAGAVLAPMVKARPATVSLREAGYYEKIEEGNA